MTQQINIPLIKDSINKTFDNIEHKINKIEQNTNQQKTNKISEHLKLFGFNKLKEIILKSEKENREYGFRICNNDNGNIEFTSLCIGNSCKLDIDRCGDKKDIGNFHTHPGGIDYLSDKDIQHSINDDEDFSCIGFVKNNIPFIKCWLAYYNVELDIAEGRIKAKKKFDNKITEYNPSGTKEGVSKLSKSKYDELSKLWTKFELLDSMLSRQSKEAAISLFYEINNGADLVINL